MLDTGYWMFDITTKDPERVKMNNPGFQPGGMKNGNKTAANYSGLETDVLSAGL